MNNYLDYLERHGIMEYEIIKSNELTHHGIIGQKWGVRRYQNKDGSLTNAGKKHVSENEKSNNKDKKISIDKETAKKVAIGTAAALTITAAAVYAYKHPEQIKKAVDMVKNSPIAKKETYTKGAEAVGKAIGKGTYKVVKSTANTGKRIATRASNTANKFVDKTVDTATSMAIAGAMAYGAKQVSNYYHSKNIPSSEFGKSVDNLVTESVKAGYNAALPNVGNYKNGNKSSNEYLSKSRDLKSVLGTPKGIRGADDERAYNNLFKNNISDDQRSLIKAMRKNGYSVDQIEEYVFHSEIINYDLLNIL